MIKLLVSTVCGLLLMTAVAVAAVNINTASVQELAGLQGIGPTKAQAIVDYRDKNGQFRTVEELAKVKGVGQKTLEKLGREITVGQ